MRYQGNATSFVLVPKPDDTGFLCLDPARLIQPLMRPVYRGQMSMIYSIYQEKWLSNIS